MKFKNLVTKQNLPMLILMGITAVLVTAAGIVFKQSFLRILPLYVSLVIALLKSRVSRFAPLLGGFNNILYALVYIYYHLYASALYALLVSCPLQLITFIRWKKRAWGQSVTLRSMTAKQRLLGSLFAVAGWGLLYIVMSLLGSSYMLLDNTLMLIGIISTVLTMLAYIEYTWLYLPNCIINVILYITMLGEHPEQLTYLIFAIYAFICSARAVIEARRLYKLQQTEKQRAVA